MRFPACIYGTTGDQVPVDSQKKICKKTGRKPNALADGISCRLVGADRLGCKFLQRK